jgi:gas vesicle protein
MNSGKVILGVLAGAAMGALLGVLFAPHKGTVTRKKIVRKSGNLADEVKDKISELLEDITEKFEKVKDDVSEFAEQKMSKIEEAKKNVKTV